ncbi:MAG: hypothetical protein RQ801_06115, partial [Spirochaetaceae bacterium]|nr:hypothetical protein [Spirochaetaceae bacterium]
MKHRYTGPGNLPALIFIILFLSMLIVMNGQFLRGTHRLDDFIDEVDSSSGNWSQLHYALLNRGLTAKIMSNRILLLQDYTQIWLRASELNFLDGMFGLDVPFERLNNELSALTNPADESFSTQSRIQSIEIALNELKTSMTDFRRQLSDGYFFLVLA